LELRHLLLLFQSISLRTSTHEKKLEPAPDSISPPTD
jgi:hypothetical protein